MTYQIGERVALSCPPGMQRDGESEITCDSSLNWSPSLEHIRCQAVAVEVPDPSNLQCKPWEKLAQDKCVCKTPHECRSSLEVCATDTERGRSIRLNVCKVRALECLGRSFSLAEDSACDWPDDDPTPCPNCQLWEKCDERSRMCVCREQGQCSEQGSTLCVMPKEGAIAVTMTECEAGIRRCRGDPISVVTLGPCLST
ncbi:hypothetical protein AGOR_G00010890 [Albula goreensis]|uniref:Sushi domain-containing protein n=1 Tax=Albula goreensis TaxID=1534307 RepID=A0A8T3E9I8_9TELE|nr:hypothetical protein AGOR_G00010890 [Albula goreensis]